MFGDIDLVFLRYCMICKYNEILVDKIKNWFFVCLFIMFNLFMFDEVDLSFEDFFY